jgi:predicted Rossmann-fold nucleotide-binding protein
MANTATARLFSLEGQTALVTGGTRGIGQAAAIALAEAGADILLIQVYFTIYSSFPLVEELANFGWNSATTRKPPR